MARGRMISTMIWKSRKVASFNLRNRLLWIGLITTADDQGRGDAHPGLIRGAIFPFEDISFDEIEDGLKAFEQAGLIMLYEAKEKTLYQIINWWQNSHQGAMRWAWPSEYPAPEGWADRLCYRQGNRVIKENWKENPIEDEGDGDCPPDDSDPTVDPSRDDNGTGAEPAPNGKSNGNGKSKNSPEGASAPPPLPDPAAKLAEESPPAPTNFQDWLIVIQGSKNRTAALRRMFVQLFPKHDPPEFGRIGMTAKRVGGAARLADLMWHASTRPPNGSPLDYIEATEKRRKANGNGRNQTTRPAPPQPAPGTPEVQQAEAVRRVLARRAARTAPD